MPSFNTTTDMAYFIHVFIDKVEKTESMPINTHDFILRMTESYPVTYVELFIIRACMLSMYSINLLVFHGPLISLRSADRISPGAWGC